MGNDMNSYFKAIKQATSNCKFPELGDLWRTYHKSSNLMDSDYHLFASTPCAYARPFRAGSAGGGWVKILYVPVTRKVSPVDRTNCLPTDHAYF